MVGSSSVTTSATANREVPSESLAQRRSNLGSYGRRERGDHRTNEAAGREAGSFGHMDAVKLVSPDGRRRSWESPEEYADARQSVFVDALGSGTPQVVDSRKRSGLSLPFPGCRSI